jgi:hypothetical protein
MQGTGLFAGNTLSDLYSHFSQAMPCPAQKSKALP